MMDVLLKTTGFEWVIFFATLAAHLPLIEGLRNNIHDKSQTFFTWGLYFVIESIIFFSLKKLDGNAVIVFGFMVGSFIMAGVLLIQNRIGTNWTKENKYFSSYEKNVFFLVLICIAFWYFIGPLASTGAGILSEAIISFHLIKETIKKPESGYNLPGYGLFLFVSVLSMFHAKNWSVEEMGFSFMETISSAIILIPLLKKKYC